MIRNLATAGILLATITLPIGAQQATPPAPGALRPYEMPRVQETRLQNGVRVVVVEQRALPVVTARIIVDAGAMYEPAAKSGLASVTAQMLREGTRSMTGPQLAERMDRLGASFFTSGSYSLAQGQVTSLRTVFDSAFALAAEAIVAPSLPAPEFARVQKEAIASFEQAMSTVEGIGSRVWQAALYEAASPYSRGSGGTGATLAAITRADVADWHRRMYTPRATTVLMVGDITMADARRLVERSFGSWRGTEAPRPQVSNATRSAQRPRVILVDRPGSVQSAIAVGAPGIGGAHADIIQMTALQHVLGGGFNSRANMNLREQHGFTYGAFTDFTTLRGTGWLSISSAVRSDATDSALVEALGEYRRIVNEPVPAAEAQAGVGNLVSSFPSSVQTVQGLAQRLQSLLLYGMPLDYYTTYRERLAAVTPADMQAMARKHLRPDAPLVVVVGDLSAIEAPIRARNLGDIEIWDRDGNRVR